MIGSSNFHAIVKCQVREEMSWHMGLYCGHRNFVKILGIASTDSAGSESLPCPEFCGALPGHGKMRQECVVHVTQRITHLLLFLPPADRCGFS